jgi:ankyrin repeat protein
MQFTDLGDLPILLIAEVLGQDRDINALVRVNRTLYKLLNPVLYRHNIRYSGNSALKWGVSNCLEGTVRLSLVYGAPIESSTGSAPGEDDDERDTDEQLEHAYGYENMSLVCIAAKKGNPYILRLLLEHGANPNCGYGTCRRVPISLAVQYGHDPIFTLLNEHGADMNPEDDPPLYLALLKGSVENVKMLLKAGADLEIFQANTGLSAVEGAVRTGDKEMFEFLVLSQRLNPYDCSGHTVLDIAAQAGQIDLAKYFLRYGLNPEREDSNERTAIFFAAMHGHLEIVESLLAARVNADKPDVNGTTPLAAAVKGNHREVSKALLSHDVDPESVDFMGRTPLYWAVHCGDPALVELLLTSNGVDPNFQAQYNHTFVALAASNGNILVVKALLDHGADPTIRDFFGRTPIVLAAMEGRTNVIKTLVKHGVDMNSADNAGRTALFWASGEDHLDTVKVLLRYGADTGKPDKDGRTPISRAAERGHLRIVKVLLQHGANAEAGDNC